MLAIGIPTLAVATWLAGRGIVARPRRRDRRARLSRLQRLPAALRDAVQPAVPRVCRRDVADRVRPRDDDPHDRPRRGRGPRRRRAGPRHCDLRLGGRRPQRARLAQDDRPGDVRHRPDVVPRGLGRGDEPGLRRGPRVLAPGRGLDRRLALGSPAGRNRPRRRLARLRPDRGDRGRHRPVVRIGRRPGIDPGVDGGSRRCS